MNVLWLSIYAGLLAFWRRRDTPDFDEVFAEFSPALARMAASYAPPGPAREDLNQEILMALWQAIPRFEGASSLRTFVFRVAHNQCIDAIRRGKINLAEPEELDTMPARQDSPEQHAAHLQQLERLARSMRAHLSPSHRQALSLALEGFSHQEIAETMGISLSAVAVRVHRARQTLKSLESEEHIS